MAEKQIDNKIMPKEMQISIFDLEMKWGGREICEANNL